MSQVYRRHECLNCGLVWTNPIRYSDSSQNVSGEAREYCPNGCKASVASSPAMVRKRELDRLEIEH